MTCIGKDPRCPCQDGDACHYKDCGGTKAWPVPKAEPPPEWLLIKNILDEYGLDAIAFVAEWKAAQQQAEPVSQAVIAGALFDFMGWLTTRDERLVLSGADEAGPAVESITEFAKMRGLSLADARVQDWQNYTTQQQAEPTCPDCKAAVLYECVACSSNNYPPKQQAEPVADEAIHAAWSAGYVEGEKAALEQQAEPEQEHITHITWDERGVRTVNGIPDDAPQRKSLAASEILNMMPSGIPAEYDGELMEFARAVEAKLKEKNK